MQRTQKFLLVMCALCAVNSSSAASSRFLLAEDLDEVRKQHVADNIISQSERWVIVEETFAGLKSVRTYGIRDGQVAAVSCVIDIDGLDFPKATEVFALLLGSVLAEGKLTETFLKLNGVQIIGTSSETDGFQNSIRLWGNWRSDYEFRIALDGCPVNVPEQQLQTPMLSLSIFGKVQMPRAHQGKKLHEMAREREQSN